MNALDQAWTRNVLHKHYHQYRQRCTTPDIEILERLRDHWRYEHQQLAREIQLIMPTVLIPPANLRELDNETITTVDVARTEKVNFEPL